MRKSPVCFIVKCVYCGKEIRQNNFKKHLTVNHGYTGDNITKVYYDRYMKSSTDGICVHCGKESKFTSLMKGYQKHCSHKCSSLSDYTKDVRKQTIRDRYGVDYVGQLEITKLVNGELNQTRTKEDWKNIHDKRITTLIRKYNTPDYMLYGSASYFNRLEEKYDTKDYMMFGSESFTTYMNEIEGGGDPYRRDTTECIEKRKRTCIGKFGADNPWKNKDVYSKCMETKLDLYGSIINHNGKHSKISQTLFNELVKLYNIIYAEHPKEEFIRIDGKLYFLDCVLADTKKVIEVFGDYWHANPIRYNKDEYINYPNNNTILVEDVWSKDKNRLELLNNEGFEILIVWENDIRTNFDGVIEKCQQFLD